MGCAVSALTDHQAAAVTELRKLLKRSGVAVLSGHAGTGKTYTGIRAPQAIGWPAGDVALLAESWKAVNVCSDKVRAAGLDDYFPVRAAAFGFLRGGTPESPGPLKHLEHAYRYAVVDEASMLRRDNFEALREWIVPGKRALLLIGDPGQLPPVRSPGGWSVFDEDLPTVELTEPMRQVADSGILRAAHAIRQGATLGELEVNGRDVLSGGGKLSGVLGESIALTARNEDRVRINAAIRTARGYTRPLHVGEFLRARYRCGAFTKETFGRVLAVRHERDGVAQATVRLSDGQVVDEVIVLSKLGAPEIMSRGWRYGYCTTAHSAQGDEWPDVTVFYRGDEDARWAYTAVTRARERLYLRAL